MKLTKLEINGFKSFAKRTELIFENGITGILGPNGCGKSNISDAFRFVLGEQSARALRGKKVEDFIFGGTEKRRSLSFCEVSMYFDNSDGALASPYSEVVVSRHAYRSGESEYNINKTPCRLKDVHDLFRDTGIGKDGYSIIGQGRVSEILSDKSNDRREAFEEAAGVMKFRTRKEEAERKLANTRKNLIRLDDIISELETRLEPLRLQSEKAIEYFKYREELRDIEINLFLYQYDKSNERIKQLTDSVATLAFAIDHAASEESMLEAGCVLEEERERELSLTISSLSQQLVSLSSSVEASAGSEKLLNEKLSTSKARIDEHIAKREQLKRLILADEGRLGEIDIELANFSSSAEDLKSDLEQMTEKLRSVYSDIEENEVLLESSKQAMMESMNRLADAKSRLSRLDAMHSALVSRLEKLKENRFSLSNEREKLLKEYSDIESSDSETKAEIKKLHEKRDSIILDSQKINSDIKTYSVQLRSVENELSAIRSRSKVLCEMKRAHEGYYTSVRRLLNDAARNTELGRRIAGVVAELISVPAKFETAIEFALGSALQNIIVPTEQDAKFVIEYLRSRDYGRATLLPITAMRPKLLNADERSLLSERGCFGIASELIECSPAHRSVIENLLGRVVIVDDLDTGIAINRRSRSSFKIATLKGDILNPGGSMTGGSVQKRELSLLGREREIEELADREKQTEKDISTLHGQIDSFNASLSEVNARLSSVEEALRTSELKIASGKEKAEIVRKYLIKNSEQLSELDEEKIRLDDALSDIKLEKLEAEKTETTLSTGNAVTGSDIKILQDRLSELRISLQNVNDESSAVRVRLTSAEKEIDSRIAEKKRIKLEIEAYHSSSSEEEKAEEAVREEIVLLEDKLTALSDNLSSERSRFDSVTDELHRLEAERAERLRSLDEKRADRQNISHQLIELRERRHKGELSLNRVQIDLKNLCDRIWNDYELTYENACEFRRSIPVTQSHIRADELRRSIKELGEVNTSSIEDYRDVKGRYDELSIQSNDLKKAEADLNELIAKLTVTMEREFVSRFALIQKNFSETFSELFRGGKAELVLSDKNDVLNCNIDIIAQPPGKKLQLLTLLSGGEQALTAIALLFAILKLKPAAFCILDEIDTSLDEANVDNFAKYLTEYSSDTQFIIITHRKGAMAVCNALYGVSMEEKGVSSLVSAKFNNE